jgi:hypothetical protein
MLAIIDPPATDTTTTTQRSTTSTAQGDMKMPDTLLLALHVTVALALTITVGVQSSELARLRCGAPTPPGAGSLRAALWPTGRKTPLSLSLQCFSRSS